MSQPHEQIKSAEFLKTLSSQDFLSFGMHDMAYIKQVHIDGKDGFAIHAADGTPLSMMETLQEALNVIEHNELESAVVQ